MPLPHRPVTVLLARFEDLIGRGLRSVLDEDEALVLVSGDVDPELLDARLAEVEPDVAILNFGSLGSPAELQRLHAAHPGTRLLVLANNPTSVEASALLAYGATACLGKAVDGRDVRTAIHLASRGMHVLPRVTASEPTQDAGPDLLTPREADVLEQLQSGRSNAEVALALSVGVETVRTHRRNIYRKLGIRSRRELTQLLAPAAGSIRL
jgi:DNA-binding NarL/FixJ family response regulator